LRLRHLNVLRFPSFGPSNATVIRLDCSTLFARSLFWFLGRGNHGQPKQCRLLGVVLLLSPSVRGRSAWRVARKGQNSALHWRGFNNRNYDRPFHLPVSAASALSKKLSLLCNDLLFGPSRANGFRELSAAPLGFFANGLASVMRGGGSKSAWLRQEMDDEKRAYLALMMAARHTRHQPHAA